MNRIVAAVVLVCIGAAMPARAQTAENVAVVINDASPDSKQIGEYYVNARSIPAENVIHIQTSTEDIVQPAAFAATIQRRSSSVSQ
jgi:hypothetical protein